MYQSKTLRKFLEEIPESKVENRSLTGGNVNKNIHKGGHQNKEKHHELNKTVIKKD